MLEITVYKSTLGPYRLEAKGQITGTQKGRGWEHCKIDGAKYYEIASSARLLANRIVTFLKLMAEDGRWKQFEDRAEIIFPKDARIFHPLDGQTRIMCPLSDEEIRELWTHLITYTERKEVRYEDVVF